MKNLLLLFIPIVFSVQAIAQNISTMNLNWSSTLTYNNTASPSEIQFVNENTQLITYSGDSIQWVAQDGSMKYRLKISKANGTWSDVSQPGLMVYEVVNNDLRGVVRIERADEIKVHLIFTTLSTPLIYTLTIDSIKTF